MNRFSILIWNDSNTDLMCSHDIFATDIPDEAIAMCKSLVTSEKNVVHEVWLFDNSTCLTVAKIYRTIDNKAFVKCYAVL